MNPERLLENNALPFAAATLVDDHEGFECALVIAKLAWRVTADGRARIAEPQREIRMGPSYFHGAGSSLQFDSDRYAQKPGTEVIMNGAAWPPVTSDRKEVSTIDVSLRVESGKQTLQKQVRVFGPRVFEKKLVNIVPSAPGAIKMPVPLIYELAEGGSDPVNPYEEGGTDPVNPVGIGHRRNRVVLEGQRTHCIEPIGGTKPAGFGAIARHWSPRAELFGTIDNAWHRNRYPVPPKDFDTRYNCSGHPDLWSPTPLQGDEPIEVLGATPEGSWRFRLPLYQPRFDVQMDGEWVERPTKLDTILIDLLDPRSRIVELTWRCAVRLPKKSERVETIRVTNAIDVPRSYYDDLLLPSAPDHHAGHIH